MSRELGTANGSGERALSLLCARVGCWWSVVTGCQSRPQGIEFFLKKLKNGEHNSFSHVFPDKSTDTNEATSVWCFLGHENMLFWPCLDPKFGI
jgi:hypothetical protein